ncbi:uncharacterized protein A1O9_13133 [Exophiala aquamarina CBS 119918]|uniref:Amidase domain-containing protein n=1 Tax=Exophiala aquamarina CBS 119918 TaxID=1182545 RepID=A0A072NUX1_9EURO|nr:uncharacterized protein A1O9_13133 [Exophiala aquamarina CBS 119918]KEF50813.1 hypothetical protein A1O9_13133 [Exophiala aquamarina CBS 119918]
MPTHQRDTDWKTLAAQKIAETSDQIRPEWLLSDSELEQARSRRDITGDFIMSFLDEAAAAITALSALELAERIKQRALTVMEITLAFCHRAAVAHQIVSTKGHEQSQCHRINVSTKFSLTKQFGGPRSLIAIKSALEPSLGLFMGSQSVSRTNSMSEVSKRPWDTSVG